MFKITEKSLTVCIQLLQTTLFLLHTCLVHMQDSFIESLYSLLIEETDAAKFVATTAD